ncbi:MAG: hypothetical protein QXH81_09625 [Thermofilaceae archaeon]
MEEWLRWTYANGEVVREVFSRPRGRELMVVRGEWGGREGVRVVVESGRWNDEGGLERAARELINEAAASLAGAEPVLLLARLTRVALSLFPPGEVGFEWGVESRGGSRRVELVVKRL